MDTGDLYSAGLSYCGFRDCTVKTVLVGVREFVTFHSFCSIWVKFTVGSERNTAEHP